MCDRVVSEFVCVYVCELCVCQCECVWYVYDYVSVSVYVCECVDRLLLGLINFRMDLLRGGTLVHSGACISRVAPLRGETSRGRKDEYESRSFPK